MKCPACEFIFFDGRDICPKCMLDLRAYKKKLGLPISNPDVPYKDLIKQRLNSGSVKATGPVPIDQLKTAPTSPDARNALTNKLFEAKQPTTINSNINSNQPAVKVSVAETIKEPANAPQETKISNLDLAKAINQISQHSGPKILDYSEGDTEIDDIIKTMENEINDVKK